jgi:hypothetical protein
MCEQAKAALAIDQTSLGDRLVYMLYWETTAPCGARDTYYGSFVPPPDVFVDGKRKNYLSITGHTILGGTINGKSGVDLQTSWDGSVLNGTVINTAKKDLDQLVVRVFRISTADMGYHPNEATEIIAELPLAALADGESDTFTTASITLGADERLVVFVQDDTNKQVFHGAYVP